MNFVFTDHPEFRDELEQEFLVKNGYFAVPAKQSGILVSMLSAISFQLFHSKVPPIVEKLKEFVSNAFNSTFSLPAYREMLSLIKKEHETMDFYRQHLIQMNRAFASNDFDEQSNQNHQQDEDQDYLFQEVLKGKSYQYSRLEQLLELPLSCQQIKEESEETSTQQTVHSELNLNSTPADSLLIESKITKLESLFKVELGDKNGRYPNENESKNNETSRSMSSFVKKGSTVVVCNKNLDEIVASEVRYDLKRQMNLGSCIIEEATDPMASYHRRVRTGIINYKLRPRRR